jgi:hypothetical protein
VRGFSEAALRPPVTFLLTVAVELQGVFHTIDDGLPTGLDDVGVRSDGGPDFAGPGLIVKSIITRVVAAVPRSLSRIRTL